MGPNVVIRLSKRFLVVAAILVLVISSSAEVVPALAQDEPRIVYVAVCSDSEMWGGVGPYVGGANPHPTMDVREYSVTVPLTVAALFNSVFRNSHRDSFGNVFKMSWFAEMDYLIAQSNFVWADGSPAGVSGYTAIRDLLVNNWGTQIQNYGDSVEYHHHFMIYDGTWQQYDNGPDAGYPEYQMYALDHMIIDRGFYPSTWRSGWFIMPPALSSWLEQWMPFDYTPTTGIWYPVHPNSMDRWQTACPYAPDVTGGVKSAFAYARDHGSAVYSFCTHDEEDMQSQVAWLQYNLNTADANETAYPNVSFKYVTAKEAMQLALGFTDFTSPTFTVTSSGGTYTIVSSEPVWKNHPYIALKYTDGTYGHMSATPTGTNTWTVTPPTSVSVVGVAGSDLYGNPGTATFTQYALTVETVGSGSVAKSPDQIMYASGTVVTLAATPQVGWSFNHWGGDASGTVNLITVNMTIDKTVTATFTPNKYSLTVTPVGSGSVNLNNSGPYYYGDAIQLAAVPNTGWSFDHWSEDLTGSINPTTILIDGNKAVTATFARIVYTLTIHTTGSGSVSTDKSAPYYWGDVVQLTASPATGWSFQYWGGDLSGSANVAMITMKADHDVTANFINKPTLSMDPTSKTCRMYGENFNVTITVSNAANVAGFAFEVKYNTTLLDYVGGTWNVWSPGTITADEVGGKITVSNSGTPPISGTQTLVTITFTASIHHIRKSVTGYTNDLTDTIYFQSISIDYTSGPSLQYSRGDSTQINVGPDFAYIFSPIQGDIDNNGVVDLSDLRTLAFFYDTINTEHNLIGDNTIDIFDLVVMAANFGYTYFP